jgi:hypothetical protein
MRLNGTDIDYCVWVLRRETLFEQRSGHHHERFNNVYAHDGDYGDDDKDDEMTAPFDNDESRPLASHQRCSSKLPELHLFLGPCW